jgi:nucleoside-diphosphate-sugar epimerase
MNIEHFKGKTFLVTGATGFIGSNLIKKLLLLGAEVIAIIHNKQSSNSLIEEIRYDGTYDSIYHPLENKKVDGIIHLATMFLSKHRIDQISDLIDSNIKFGAFLLEVAKIKKIPFFINTTTYAQFYDHNGYNPQNFYAATKQSFEDIVKYYEVDSDVFILTLELTDTYGDGDPRPKFINQLLNAIQNNLTFKMSKGEQEINYLNVEDASDAFITAIKLIMNKKLETGKHFSVFGNETYKLIDLVHLVCSNLNSNISIDNEYYPYRNREIMKYEPTYTKLPSWNAKISLLEGISKLISK